MEITNEMYKGVKVKGIAVQVTEKDVIKELSKIINKMSVYVPVERAELRAGDEIIADIKAEIDGVVIDDLCQTNEQIIIGEDDIFDDATTQLIGKTRSSATMDFLFPQDWYQPEFRGKKAKYTFTIHELKEPRVPKFDDDFVKDATEFNTKDEYMAYMKGVMQERMEQQAVKAMANEAVNQVIKNFNLDGEVPEAAYEAELAVLMEEYKADIEGSGMTIDEYLSMTGKSMDDVEAELKPLAIEGYQRKTVLSIVAKREMLRVSEAEVENELNEIADEFDMDPEEFKKVITKETRDLVEQDILFDKAEKYILGNAVII